MCIRDSSFLWTNVCMYVVCWDFEAKTVECLHFEHYHRFIITACTVVQDVVKTNSQSNGNGQISTPRRSKTPERISLKPRIYNYVGGVTTHGNPPGAATTWVVSANTWHVTCFGFLGKPFFITLKLTVTEMSKNRRPLLSRLWQDYHKLAHCKHCLPDVGGRGSIWPKCFYTASPLLLPLSVSSTHDLSYAFRHDPETGIDAAECDLQMPSL